MNFEFENCENGLMMKKPRRLVFNNRLQGLKDAIQYCLWQNKNFALSVKDEVKE